MSEYLITIDGGTTNTRAALWHGDSLLVTAARNVGVRNRAMDGKCDVLNTALKECIDEVLKKSGNNIEQVKGIIVSGMLSSDMGLVEIPHVQAPIRFDELALQMQEVYIESICSLPMLFIPGVKNKIDTIKRENFGEMDMMRGEETEAAAIWSEMSPQNDTLIFLPGSHTKTVAIDGTGRITGCLTTIGGELLAAITCHTLLTASVGGRFAQAEDYDIQMVRLGAKMSAEVGLSRACFGTRIYHSFVDQDEIKAASFLLGAVLQEDIQALKHSQTLFVAPSSEILVAGKNPLRHALVDLLHSDGYFQKVHEYVPISTEPLAARGARVLYELRKRRWDDENC